MSSTIYALDTTWPTTVTGRPDTSSEALQVLHTRVDLLDDTVLTVVCHRRFDTTLDKCGQLEDASTADSLDVGRQRVRAALHEAVDNLPGAESLSVLYSDGLRWRVGRVEEGWAYSSDEHAYLEMLDASGVCVAPTDGPEFYDVGAVAAVISVLDEVAAVALDALDSAGLTPDQRAAAEQALSEARLNIVGSARTVRKALAAVHTP